MKRFLTLALTCLPLLCFGATTYTTYFNNTHTYTNATVVGTNFAGRGVFTNGITAGASTFTGNLTLGDSSAATYTLSSALSGATDPVLTFQNGAIANDRQWYGPDGTAAAPGFAFTSSTNSGLRYASSAPTLVKAGVDRVRIDDGNLGLGSTYTVAWGSSTDPNSGKDTVIGRDSAGVLQMGGDSASTASQTLKGPDGSGSNIAGGAMRIDGGYSTGTGAGGPAVIRTANSAGGTSSSINTVSERFHAAAKWVTLTSATATTLFTIPVPATNYVGLTATVTVYATDGTDHQSKTSVITVDSIAKTTTITPTISQVDNTTAASAGTLTCTYTAVDNTSNVLAVKATADSSLSETVLRAKIVITAINASGTGLVTEQ